MNKDNCYFCNKPTPDSTETVSGKPDDNKVCPDCLLLHMPAILGARRLAEQFDAL